jgi:uncharacterized OB-fold protein
VKFRAEFPLPDVAWEPLRPFWAGAARSELVLPRCASCARFVWYPDGPCRWCGSGTSREWTCVSGRGRLFSWSIVHRAFIPQLAPLVPFVTGLVAIEEDPAVRLATLIVDCPHDRLRIDMPVHVTYRPLEYAGVPSSVIAPLFAPSHGASSAWAPGT